jgi:hypothetical protein
MIRALLAAWQSFLFVWRHRQAGTITIERRAEYCIPDAEALDFEWMLAQHHADFEQGS